MYIHDLITKVDAGMIADLIAEIGYHDMADSIRTGNDVWGKPMPKDRYRMLLEEADDVIDEYKRKL